MKYLHEKMEQIQSNANEIKVSESEVIEHDHALLSTHFFFNPCILCSLFFIIILAAI